MGTRGSPSVLLFMSVFTSQAAVLVLSPILVDIAHDLDVSTATAGQLRIIAAPVAACVAFFVARTARRLPVRPVLQIGAALIAVGSLASAAAPSFVALALAQIPMWIGVAVLVAAGIGAAGSWSGADERGKVVARALAGAPAAWIVGMPAIGLVAHANWRFAFLVVPLPAALATQVILTFAQPDQAERRADASLAKLLRSRGARGWAFSELAAMSAWAGTLVFSGALFVETYGTSSRATGVLLATAAVAYLVGNTAAGRIHHDCVRRALARVNVAAGVAVTLMWAVTPSLPVTLALFALAAIAVGARTVVGTTYGFALAGERKLEIGAARAVITHIGYLVGASVGGAALAVGGRPAMGIAFGSLLLVGTIPHLAHWNVACRPRRVVFGY